MSELAIVCPGCGGHNTIVPVRAEGRDGGYYDCAECGFRFEGWWSDHGALDIGIIPKVQRSYLTGRPMHEENPRFKLGQPEGET